MDPYVDMTRDSTAMLLFQTNQINACFFHPSKFHPTLAIEFPQQTLFSLSLDTYTVRQRLLPPADKGIAT